MYFLWKGGFCGKYYCGQIEAGKKNEDMHLLKIHMIQEDMRACDTAVHAHLTPLLFTSMIFQTTVDIFQLLVASMATLLEV